MEDDWRNWDNPEPLVLGPLGKKLGRDSEVSDALFERRSLN
jgi:hypothetical protein